MEDKGKMGSQRLLFLAISLAALGTTITASFDRYKTAGIVLIALAGFFLIAGFRKRNSEKDKD